MFGSCARSTSVSPKAGCFQGRNVRGGAHLFAGEGECEAMSCTPSEKRGMDDRKVHKRKEKYRLE